MKITLQQLHAFARIARTGNLGLAAHQLALSKGAVSQALQALEQQLGTPLFDRIHPRLQLNHAGLRLQPLAEELLTRAFDISALFTGHSEPALPLRLGASQTIGNYLLPTLLATSAPRDITPASNAPMPTVFIANSQALVSAIFNFELDLALVEADNPHPLLVSEPWLRDEMVILAAPNQPWVAHHGAPLPLSALRGAPWVLREPHSGSREHFERYVRPALSAWQLRLELNSVEAVLLACAQGLGVTCLSARAAAPWLASGRLQQLPLIERQWRQFFLLWHKQTYLSQSARAFVRVCQQFAPEADAL
ncbi:MAG: LysR substrate-binding domain-containing protein [Aeromonas sp.]